MKLKIALLPGDGIGGEVITEAVKILRAVAELCEHEFEFAEYEIGGAAIKKYNSPLPIRTLDGCMSADAVLLGAVGAPEFDSLAPGARPEAGLLTLRKALNGYANLRPVTVYEPLIGSSPLRAEIIQGVSILFVRELLGGLYFGEPRGFQNYGEPATAENADEAFNTLRYSAAEIERVARIAFKAARARRGKVTSVDKANVLETSQLWRRTVARVHATEFRDVELEHMYVDACAMHLLSNPRRFDVVLTENLFGDILSDEAAVLSGSLGLLASASLGGAVDLYEPVHGSAPDIAGRGLANPIGAILSAAMLLRYTAHLEQEARDIETAVGQVLAMGGRTADLQEPHARAANKVKTRGLGTAEMGARIAETLAEIIDMRYAYHAV